MQPQIFRRYLNPKNGREYVYVDSAQDIRARGWYLCEAVHGTTQDNAVQVTEIMEQSYFDTFANYTTRENATQPGVELDVNRSHLGEMLNAYMLPVLLRSAERSQELTAKMVREATQQQTQTFVQDQGLSR